MNPLELDYVIVTNHLPSPSNNTSNPSSAPALLSTVTATIRSNESSSAPQEANNTDVKTIRATSNPSSAIPSTVTAAISSSGISMPQETTIHDAIMQRDVKKIAQCLKQNINLDESCITPIKKAFREGYFDVIKTLMMHGNLKCGSNRLYTILFKETIQTLNLTKKEITKEKTNFIDSMLDEGILLEGPEESLLKKELRTKSMANKSLKELFLDAVKMRRGKEAYNARTKFFEESLSDAITDINGYKQIDTLDQIGDLLEPRKKVVGDEEDRSPLELGYTPLMIAAAHNNTSFINELVKKFPKLNVNQKIRMFTPLQIAINHKRNEAAWCLFHHGAQPSTGFDRWYEKSERLDETYPEEPLYPSHFLNTFATDSEIKETYQDILKSGILEKTPVRSYHDIEMQPKSYPFANETLLSLLKHVYSYCCSKINFYNCDKVGNLYPTLNESDKAQLHKLLINWATMYNFGVSQSYFRGITGELLYAIAPYLSIKTIKQFEPYIALLKDDFYAYAVREASRAETAFEKRKQAL